MVTECPFSVPSEVNNSAQPVYLQGWLAPHSRIVRAASSSPPSYSETCQERAGDSALWTGHAPFPPAAAQTVKLDRSNGIHTVNNWLVSVRTVAWK